MKRLLWLLQWLLKATIFFTLFAFALNNQQETRVNFFFQHLLVSPHGAGGAVCLHAGRGGRRAGHGAALVARASSRQEKHLPCFHCPRPHIRGDRWSLT